MRDLGTTKRLYGFAFAGMLVSAAVWAVAPDPARSQQASPLAREIHLQIDHIRELGSLEITGRHVGSDALMALYQSGGFEPLWTDDRVAGLRSFVAGVGTDGLDPTWYAASVLDSLAAAPGRTPREQANRDIFFSHVFLEVGNHVHGGVVELADLGEGWEQVPRVDPVPIDSMRTILTSGDVGRGLAGLRPDHFIYQGLVSALARYRAIESAGGWPSVGEGAVLAADSVSDRVPALRLRLLRTGDLPPGSDSTSTTFDSTVEEGVKRFQRRYRLNEDGLVGNATAAALDVPVAERIVQLRLNLERARWVTPGLANDFVAVNIAGQIVYVVEDGNVAWETRAVVGQTYRKTPIFKDSMQYVVLNPTWTVPRSINGEILSSISRTPGYLSSRNFSVIDRSGAPLDPSSIDFSAYSGTTFPYTFRQGPGAGNALGRVKFMFPNPHNVYLHDTPSRSLFGRDERTFSHGCIRVQDPLRLAEILLRGQGIDRAEIDRVIESGETRTIQLEEEIPVLILYWTASTDFQGEVHFFSDVYDRDGALEEAFFSSHASS
jgi:murein L,D-transpeptidase YcbB/YkuD